MPRVRLLTPQRMAELLRVSVERVRGALLLIGLEPEAIADATPVYKPDALAKVRHELNRQDAADTHDG